MAFGPSRLPKDFEDKLHWNVPGPQVADLEQVVAKAAYGERIVPVAGATYRDATDGKLYRITRVHAVRRIRGQLSAIFEADEVEEEQHVQVGGVDLPAAPEGG
jgi:hypothetical protein